MITVLSILAIGSLLLVLNLSLNNFFFWYSLSEEIHSIKNAAFCIEDAYVFKNCSSFVKRPVILKNGIISTEHFSIIFHLKANGSIFGNFECKNEGGIICKVK